MGSTVPAAHPHPEIPKVPPPPPPVFSVSAAGKPLQQDPVWIYYQIKKLPDVALCLNSSTDYESPGFTVSNSTSLAFLAQASLNPT